MNSMRRFIHLSQHCLATKRCLHFYKLNFFQFSPIITTTNNKRLMFSTMFSRRSFVNDQENISNLDDHDEDENSYWASLQASLESDDKPYPINRLESDSSKSEINVFVLQLKMQYKSKARQSTTADLQLQESLSLVNTLDGWRVIDQLIIGSKRSNSKEIFGSGNQEILSKKIASSGANCLFIVIDRLTNMQVKSIRRTLLGNDPNIKIYDRYTIVLEIFKRNARSSIAKLQIALAEIPYIRHKFDNHDLYKNAEKKIHHELDAKLKTRNLLNNQRREKNIPTIAVFGYTNVGKTSFIKIITHDNKMEPKNKLFATLDITYHGTSMSNSNQSIVFVDTIGFISDIPTNLVESFRTSLSDAMNAHLLIHLVDISHPDRVAQENSVLEILSELAPEDKLKNMLTIYNKCDQIDQKHLLSDNNANYYVSCKTGQGIEQIKQVIEKKILKILEFIELNLKISQGSPEMAYLYKNAIIKENKECLTDSQYMIMNVLMNKVNALKFIKLFPKVTISNKSI